MVFQLFSGEDQSLLIWRNSFFVLNLGLDVFDGVRGFDFEGDRLSGEGLDENLHSSPKSKDQMKGRFLLDVVVGQSTAIFELFTGENETLLVWWDTFFVLDLCFDVFDGVRGFDFEGDGLSGEGLDENLHSSSESK